MSCCEFFYCILESNTKGSNPKVSIFDTPFNSCGDSRVEVCILNTHFWNTHIWNNSWRIQSQTCLIINSSFYH